MSASSIYLVVVLGLLSSQIWSLSATRAFRKSTLLPWNYVEDRIHLGHCVEERDAEAKVLTVRISTAGDHDDVLTLTFPEDKIESEGLASQLWPASLASSVLLQSPEFREFLNDKDTVELGSGTGLAGLVAAASSKSCLLTDNDKEAVGILETGLCPANQENLTADLSTQQLDWRDDHRGQVSFADVVLGSDIAYYWYLLRPIMDTARAFMDADKNKDTDAASTLVVVGQANRESQWDLYNNIQGGCYNQLTDEDEPSWPGTSRMLLYNLQLSEWCDSLEDCEEKIDSVIPISVIVHHDETASSDERLELLPFKAHAYVATKEDDESIMKSF